eukprot:6468159-Amphidinium_carterae.6
MSVLLHDVHCTNQCASHTRLPRSNRHEEHQHWSIGKPRSSCLMSWRAIVTNGLSMDLNKQ